MKSSAVFLAMLCTSLAVSGCSKAAAGDPIADAKAPAKAQQIQAGQVAFVHNCSACHQANGKGLPGAFPPLAGSDYLSANPTRAAGIVVHGLTGPVTVNGKQFNSVMPPLSKLSDDDIANALTYVMNSWGNAGGAITPEDVRKAR